MSCDTCSRVMPAGQQSRLARRSNVILLGRIEVYIRRGLRGLAVLGPPLVFLDRFGEYFVSLFMGEDVPAGRVGLWH